jgi:hypothetical protein
MLKGLEVGGLVWYGQLLGLGEIWIKLVRRVGG